MISPSDRTETPAEILAHADMIRAVAKIFEDSRLTEIDYQRGDLHIRLTRHQTRAETIPPSYFPPQTQAVPESPKPSIPKKAVSSPMVGTVYLAPKPGADPFVKVGDPIEVGQVVLIIEAMKVMNPIKATISGRVTQVLVNNGAPVEYGEELLWLE